MGVSIKQFINFNGIADDLKSFNFSVYGQWFGYLNIIFCFAFGIANLFHINAVIIFSIIAIVQGLVLLFVEIPFLLKICPLSNNFIEFIKKFETNQMRTILYIIMAIIQWCSLILMTTSLIVVAIGFTISFISYGVAWLKKQNFQSTSIIKRPTDDDFPTEAVVREML